MRIFLIVTVLLKLPTLLLLNRRNRMSGYLNTAANSMGLMWNPLGHNCKNYRINEVLFASWGSQRATRLWIPALSFYTTTTWLISIFRGQPGPSSIVITSSNPIFSSLLMEIFFWICLLLSSIQRVTTKVCLYPSVDSMSLDSYNPASQALTGSMTKLKLKTLI